MGVVNRPHFGYRQQSIHVSQVVARWRLLQIGHVSVVGNSLYTSARWWRGGGVSAGQAPADKLASGDQVS
jgi:hypothetical protein